MQIKSLEAKLNYFNFKNKPTKIIRVSEKKSTTKKNLIILKVILEEPGNIINNIVQENTSHFKQSSINRIVSEGKKHEIPI